MLQSLDPQPLSDLRVRANLGSAGRLLTSAGRAIEHRDARLAHRLLAMEDGVRGGMRPVPDAVRADAAVEMVVDLSMRLADLARVGWRPDRRQPEEDEVERLLAELAEVEARVHRTVRGGQGLDDLIVATARADGHAASLLRASDAGRQPCLAC